MAPVDFNCDRWKAEWEAVRIENLTSRQIWEQAKPFSACFCFISPAALTPTPPTDRCAIMQMTHRVAEIEHQCEKKIGALRQVSKDWINKASRFFLSRICEL